MRIWLCNPAILCDQHLLGEHVEIHMFVGSMNKNKPMQGFIDKNLLDGILLHRRHDDLVKEMRKRGMVHKSPLPELIRPPISTPIDVLSAMRDLITRCDICCQNMIDLDPDRYQEYHPDLDKILRYHIEKYPYYV